MAVNAPAVKKQEMNNMIGMAINVYDVVSVSMIGMVVYANIVDEQEMNNMIGKGFLVQVVAIMVLEVVILSVVAMAILIVEDVEKE